jgi:acyl carrier protein
VAELSRALDPETPLEAQLASLWCEVLKRERVGRDESFFDLGGHSLLAIRLLGKISKAVGIRLSLRALFDAPTIRQLAAAITTQGAMAGAGAPQ